jgi:hypothetical protein
MSMPRGLKIASNYYNKLEAWRDWRRVQEIAEYFELNDEIKKLMPEVNASFKQIDAQRHKLQDSIEPYWRERTSKPLPWDQEGILLPRSPEEKK